MAQEFLFSCTSCEKDFPVTVKLAGMAYRCPLCDATNDLPGLRQLKQLPVHENAAIATTSRNEAQSWLFSGGLLVAVIAGVCASALLWYANQLFSESLLDERIAFGRTQINTLTPGHLWDAWDGMTEDGLPDWQETFENRYNKQSGHLRNIAYGLFGLAGLGLLAMLGSFFFRGKR